MKIVKFLKGVEKMIRKEQSENMEFIYDECTDLGKIRKRLTEEDYAKLEDYLLQATPKHGMSGKERLMLYKLASTTDLTPEELVTITWDKIFQLPAELSKEFEEWQKETGAKNDDKVFDNCDVRKVNKMWRKDIREAGISL